MKNLGDYMLKMLATALGVGGLVGTSAALLMLMARIDESNSFSVSRLVALLVASVAVIVAGWMFDSIRTTVSETANLERVISDKFGLCMAVLLWLGLLMWLGASIYQGSEIAYLKREINALHWKANILLQRKMIGDDGHD